MIRRIVALHHSDLGTIVGVYDAAGRLVTTAAPFADGKHRNCPCDVAPFEGAPDERG